ncbi:MAG: HAMP domain-containing sensor histidine kinase [Alphaproteobacteria bacterium]
MTHWFATLRAQFGVITAAAVILSNLLAGILFEYFHERELSSARNAALAARVGAVADLVSTLPQRQHIQVLQAVSTRFTRFRIADAAPNLSPMGEEERALARQLRAAERATPGEIHVSISSGAEAGSAAKTVTEIAQTIAPGRWMVVRNERPVPRGPRAILIAAAAAVLVTCAAAAWLAGRVARPLSQLATAADTVARGGNTPRLDVRGPDDLRRAAEAFNAMSDRVQRTLDSHRQLLSAVGHDLRTPISAMRITAELVQDAEIRDRLTRNLEELQALTETVLDAARAAPGEEMRRVDLIALMESVCGDLSDLGQSVECGIEGSAPCICRPNELRRALRNLVENAVRYGARARVHLEQNDTFHTIVVEDDGPGIPPEQLERVFEPFVRLESSRSSATGGAGLGLTLARTIAREHGGDVTLENRKGSGLRVRLTLPREAP